MDFFITRDFSFLIWNYEFWRNNGMVLRVVSCSLRNVNSTEAQRKHENHQGRPKLTSYSETQPQETDEQGEKKRPVHSTEEKLLPIVAKKGPR